MIVGLSHSIKNLARVLNESDSPMPSEEIRDSLVLTNQEFKDGLSGLHQFLQMATSLGESVIIAE